MSQTPFEYVGGLQIGTVEYVSPDEIKVLLDVESPESIALNTGTPRPFPRVNSYLLIPNEEGYFVGQIEWLTVERSAFPKRRGMRDFGLVDLPYPLRRLSLNPLGVLYKKRIHDQDKFSFRRGMEAFPTIGDGVFLPTDNQLRSIVESCEKPRIKIGTSPLAGNADVYVDPDRLFGRHLAVLGNTGSGKSCTVAGLIRWSLEAARKETDGTPNARFIILDPNGEYARAFSNENETIKARIFRVGSEESSGEDNTNQLQVPLWFWNSSEWCSFSQAREGAQRPLLRRALREIKNGNDQPDLSDDFVLRRKISSILINLRNQVRKGDNYEGWKLGPKLEVFLVDIISFIELYPSYSTILSRIRDEIDFALNQQKYTRTNGTVGYNAFPVTYIESIIYELTNLLDSLGGLVYQSGPDEDCPLPYSGSAFADHLEELANQETNPQYFDYLIMRIRMMLSDTRINSIVGDEGDLSLTKWLTDYIGANKAENGQLTIIDLSLVPPEIIHIVTAVIARMVFEALQRYRKISSKSLPTVLVMEEAHTFIKRYQQETDHNEASIVCCQVFEKIAREGRKFGLGLLLSSQRPSELSQTVLSQCNTFILHRISNDRDQELVHKLVPDNLRGLLRELPTLPSQNAILLGWASELPVLLRINDLPKKQQPQSDDPDFWSVWTGIEEDGRTVERSINWQEIADDWQGIGRDEETKTAKPYVAPTKEEPEGNI